MTGGDRCGLAQAVVAIIDQLASRLTACSHADADGVHQVTCETRAGDTVHVCFINVFFLSENVKFPPSYHPFLFVFYVRMLNFLHPIIPYLFVLIS